MASQFVDALFAFVANNLDLVTFDFVFHDLCL